MEAIGIIVCVLFLTFVSTVLRGYALSKLWEWFIVATFSLPSINIPTAIGISLIVSFLTAKVSTRKDDQTEDFYVQLSKSTLVGLMLPLIALFMGWIVTFWMQP